MSLIILHTTINAPLEVCFDLSRSIELHQISTKKSDEKVIAGKMSGLISLHETVTWKARHFGLWLQLTSKVTEYNAPNFFVDEMVSGPFKSFRHEHIFEIKEGHTIMTDRFEFQSPLGFLGKFVNGLFLKSYMEKLLTERNLVIKESAEGDAWRELLSRVEV
ncbi:SRPBCC family protein [Sporocytophaga myxococcoides]|uniref:SRPBCC family protein n=1 Tax=Sporocytophaga myxococcoides TaxID=153721 RepID=UPI0004032861|nr:SRPBCC family protein [Sporocytophaga myxococcoides]